MMPRQLSFSLKSHPNPAKHTLDLLASGVQQMPARILRTIFNKPRVDGVLQSVST